MTNLSRREFIKTASAGAIVIPHALADTVNIKSSTGPVCVFTKCLQFLDYEAVGVTLARAGYEGADLAVRKGGQVLPENVRTDLPKAVKALRKSGIKVPMMVTDINDPDDPLTETVLGTASQLGLTHYRMAYLRYDPSRTIPQNLDEHKKVFEKLEKINRKYNIRGGYQNHSGTNVGGPVWDLYLLLKDCDPAFIGVQYDIRHAVAEGGVAWPLGLRLLAPWINSTCIKDFYWKKENNKWILLNVPLGEGMVKFDEYLKEYKKLQLSGPVSIHLEYNLGGAESGKMKTTMPLAEIEKYLKNDVDWFRKKMLEYSI